MYLQHLCAATYKLEVLQRKMPTHRQQARSKVVLQDRHPAVLHLWCMRRCSLPVADTKLVAGCGRRSASTLLAFRVSHQKRIYVMFAPASNGITIVLGNHGTHSSRRTISLSLSRSVNQTDSVERPTDTVILD